VPVVPNPEAQERDCFYAVAQQCERDGGETVYGWNIWTWPAVWLKAEHHAVWRPKGRELVDITPKANNASRIVFLPDPSRTYDFARNTRLRNIVKPLKPDSDIKALIKAEHAIYDYEEACTVNGTLEMSVDPQIYFGLMATKEVAFGRLLTRYVRPGQSCPCGSGVSFRNCHALQVLLS